MIRLFLVIAITAIGRAAAAEPTADEWAKVGRTHLAKKRHKLAIAAFRRAFAIQPKLAYRCNIGVAAYHDAQWARAYVALSVCLAGSAGFPASVRKEMRRALSFVESELALGAYARVRVVLAPRAAMVSMSFLDPDDTFVGSRIVWVPIGSHVFRVSAKGYQTRTFAMNVTSRATLEQTFSLARLPPPAAPPPAPASTSRPAPSPAPHRPDVVAPPSAPSDLSARPGRATAWLVYGAAAVALAGGIAFHAKALGTVDEVAAQTTRDAYDDKAAQLRREQYWVGGLYTAAALAAGVGTYLWLRRSRRSRPRVGAAIGRRQAAIWAAWRL